MQLTPQDDEVFLDRTWLLESNPGCHRYFLTCPTHDTIPAARRMVFQSRFRTPTPVDHVPPNALSTNQGLADQSFNKKTGKSIGIDQYAGGFCPDFIYVRTRVGRHGSGPDTHSRRCIYLVEAGNPG